MPDSERFHGHIQGHIQAHLLTPAGFVRGMLQHHEGRIVSIDGTPVTEAAVRADAATPLVLPGFIDLHVHGGGGADTMDASTAIDTIARQHARHGTTALLATTMTAPLADIRAALQALAPAIARRPAGVARVLGVHLEGPYISPDKLGAQPAFARPPSLSEVLALHAIAPIRLVTMAPEVAGNLALIPQLVAAGIRVQIGHTDAGYDDAVAALRQGASSFTHLYNAMSAFHHRAPGAVGAALAHAERAEIIPDLLHVHPGAIRAALRAIPGLYCVTDATAATGMPDGDYRLGRQTVTKCLGGVRLADGTLAGSTLTMDQALRNLVSIGLTLADASARVSSHAAHYLGLSDHGVLAPGAVADWVVLDAPSLALQQVVIAGIAVDPITSPAA
ncbi:MAG: N-acetylglucosamine-6-phosphate deacetylase [Rubrivivax sp.]